MKKFICWYQCFIWIGIAINLLFAIPALIAPDFLISMLGLPPNPSDPWLGNAGMLLLGISLFYMPSGFNAPRFPVHSWLCVLSRLIAVVFWIYLIRTSPYAPTFKPLAYSDGAMFVILGVLLYLGSAPENRPLALLGAGIAAFCRGFAQRFADAKFRIAFIVIVLLLAFFGYETWVNLLREIPQPAFASDEEHFKYAPIGLGMEARIPYYIFSVMPELCQDKMPVPGGWEAFGFVFEKGKELPIGMAKRQIGYATVEPNCALCHTGSYRQSANSELVPVPTAPAERLDLEAFQWFAYDCATSPKFTATNVMAAIDQKFKLGFMESLYYRFAIVPLAKQGLTRQKQLYAWQKLRPLQGPGRTDTFNPTKMVVFGFPDDSTIGTVDLPQIWNQKPRETLYLHWDGNNNNIRERNYAAAMAVGATPQSVLPENFKRVTDWLLTHKAPAWPFALDQQKVERGNVLWQQHCAACHDFGQPATGQVTVDIDTLGTDPHRLNSFTVGLVDKFHQFKTPPFDFDAYRKTQSYSNTPTDGIWMRAPYLHNGSVPTLWDLLQAPERRPEIFYRGSNVIDEAKVGFVSDGPDMKEPQYFKFDTRLPGNHNSGHVYGTQLSDEQKWDLIEYMKTL